MTAASLREGILDQPLSRAPSHSRIALAGTVCLHLALVAGIRWLHHKPEAKTEKPVPITQWVEVALPAEPPAPLAEEPAPKAVRVRAPEATTAAPPPEAAQAGQVLAAEEEVVDFGDTYVAGSGTTYAGGVTEAGGSSTQAVRDSRARAGGVAGGTGTDLQGDRSRPPRLAGEAVWDCPFPYEADDAGVDHAVVTLQVEVSADGGVHRARATQDPGHGFGREAQRCALSKHWDPGLNRAGHPEGAVATVLVHFDR